MDISAAHPTDETAVERLAYQLANRLLREPCTGRYFAEEFACPGHRRSLQLDAIAAVIREEVENYERARR
jgi:hypothetical protein